MDNAYESLTVSLPKSQTLWIRDFLEKDPVEFIREAVYTALTKPAISATVAVNVKTICKIAQRYGVQLDAAREAVEKKLQGALEGHLEDEIERIIAEEVQDA
ncbi:MAG: hypothetical protein WHV66_00330 [Anaerolineales bacterium]